MSLPEASLALRVSDLEWSYRSGREDLQRLGWVEMEADPDLPLYRFRHGGDKILRFTQGPLLATLPPSIAAHVADQQAQGRATAWQGLRLVLARIEWMVNARQHLWAPWSPEPRILASVAETYGVEAAVHQNKGEVLARLCALLPAWHPHRGSLARALEVIDAAGLRAALTPWLPKGPSRKPRPLSIAPFEGQLADPTRARRTRDTGRPRAELGATDEDTDDNVTQAGVTAPVAANVNIAQVQVDADALEALPEDEDDATAGSALQVKVQGVRRVDVLPEGAVVQVVPSRPMAGGELLACRNLSWWLQRTETSADTETFISGGFVRLSRPEPEGPSDEDVSLGWASTPIPHALFRLLPAWATVRLHDASDSKA